MSIPLPHTLSSNGDYSSLTVLFPGSPPELRPIDSNHPNYTAVKAKVDAGSYDGLLELFDVGATVNAKFQKLSTRVAVEKGELLFDGDVMDNVLAKQIMRAVNEGTEDFAPLVAFLEKVAANPSEHSREQLYVWLDKHEFTITERGDIVGYRGLRDDYTSRNAGPGIVNGERSSGHLDNSPGNVVEIARSSVVANSFQGCAHGLHVGTFDYAKSWSRGKLVEVHVDPRDVVSVPTDCSAQKMRVCRYKVIRDVSEKYTSAVKAPGEDDLLYLTDDATDY